MSNARPSHNTIKDIYRRDGHTCQNCGANGKREDVALEVHHIVPLADGGSNEPSNLTTLCRECHQAIHTDSKAATSSSQSGTTGSSNGTGADAAWMAIAFSSVYAAAAHPVLLLGGVLVITLIFFAAGMTVIPALFLLCSGTFIGIMQYAKAKGSGGLIDQQSHA